MSRPEERFLKRAVVGVSILTLLLRNRSLRWRNLCLGLLALCLGGLSPSNIRAETLAPPWPAAFGDVVSLRVGEHALRIPRAYFRHPPSRSGVDEAFYIRALLPHMEPEIEANRQAFRASVRTAEGQRVLQILLLTTKPPQPWPVARWTLQNSARGSVRQESNWVDLEDFLPATPETFGLRVWAGRPRPSGTAIDDDLYYGSLADGRFAGMRCRHEVDPDRVTSCRLMFDWRQDTWIQVTFIRSKLPEWRAIAEATLALVDAFAVNGSAR